MKRQSRRTASATIAMVIGTTLCLPSQARADLEEVGDILQIALPAAGGIATLFEPTWEGSIQWSASFGTAIGTSSVIKIAVEKTRPTGSSLSYPSGHTTASFMGASFIQRRYGWGLGRAGVRARGADGLQPRQRRQARLGRRDQRCHPRHVQHLHLYDTLQGGRDRRRDLPVVPGRRGRAGLRHAVQPGLVRRSVPGRGPAGSGQAASDRGRGRADAAREEHGPQHADVDRYRPDRHLTIVGHVRPAPARPDGRREPEHWDLHRLRARLLVRSRARRSPPRRHRGPDAERPGLVRGSGQLGHRRHVRALDVDSLPESRTPTGGSPARSAVGSTSCFRRGASPRARAQARTTFVRTSSWHGHR